MENWKQVFLLFSFFFFSTFSQCTRDFLVCQFCHLPAFCYFTFSPCVVDGVNTFYTRSFQFPPWKCVNFNLQWEAERFEQQNCILFRILSYPFVCPALLCDWGNVQSVAGFAVNQILIMAELHKIKGVLSVEKQCWGKLTKNKYKGF